MSLNHLNQSLPATPRMPVIFLGHGSPMNAIEENEFVEGFRGMGNQIGKPWAVLCISAHWETRGSFVTAMEHPKTIHDFGGFPAELYEVQYPASGSPFLAGIIRDTVQKTEVGLDYKWGLDHGAWSVIKHMYPQADVPVIQMSIDYTRDTRYHFELAAELRGLREKGVLIVGSGNMVHNLGMLAWNRMNETFAYDWAIEAGEKMKDFILNHDVKSLIAYPFQGKAFELAIPSPEHFLPLIYVMALADEKEDRELFNDKPVAGSISMTSVKIG